MQTTTTTARGRAVGTAIALITAMAIAFTLLGPAISQASDGGVGGPVILMGLDSELAPGGSGHGPPDEHAAMVQALFDSVRNGGEGILVIGGGSNVQNYWQGDVGDGLDPQQSVDFVRGDDIATVDFDGYAIIGVSSSFRQITNGLTQAENEKLIDRADDIRDFVNAGGGLLGKTQDGMNDPFGYVGPIGNFVALTSEDGVSQYSTVEVTPAGEALGLTTSGMSGWCCWHDVFDTFPAFMEVLVTHNAGGTHQGYAAAIGGLEVVIPADIEASPSSATRELGEAHTVTALVQDDDGPMAGVDVDFEVTDGPHTGTTGAGTTGSDGTTTFSYTGSVTGLDTIQSSFVDGLGNTRTSDEVTVEWVPGPVSLDLAPAQANGTIGDDHSVTATLMDGEGQLVTDAAITFTIIGGPHEGTTGSADTDADGQATFTYTGHEVGSDRIVATYAPDDGDEVTSNEATMAWVEVLAEGEEAEEAQEAEEDESDEDDEDDEVEEIEEADAADAVEAQPDFTG